MSPRTKKNIIVLLPRRLTKPHPLLVKEIRSSGIDFNLIQRGFFPCTAVFFPQENPLLVPSEHGSWIVHEFCSWPECEAPSVRSAPFTNHRLTAKKESLAYQGRLPFARKNRLKWMKSNGTDRLTFAKKNRSFQSEIHSTENTLSEAWNELHDCYIWYRIFRSFFGWNGKRRIPLRFSISFNFEAKLNLFILQCGWNRKMFSAGQTIPCNC